MATVRFAAEVDVHAPLEVVWETATHWPSHGRWVPLTAVTVLEDAGGLGTRFVGRTALGPVGFDDPMTVTLWEPPIAGGATAACTVTKTGRLLTGTAGFTLTQVDADVCRIAWFEDVDITPRWLTRPFGRLLGSLAAPGLRQTLRKMAADAAAAPHS